MADDDGYPAGENLAKHWNPTGSTGSFEIPVRGLREGVVLEWTGYLFREGSYLASYFGENFLGIFRRGGKPFLVTEIYVDTSITNSGKRVRRFRRVSADGVCVTEIVRAHQSGEALNLVLESGKRRLEAVRTRDHSFHEIEIETFHARAEFDLRRRTAFIERSRYRDAST